MVKEEEPLVSIIVITYNSSKYVLETLESAKAQTYQNIELIVSDDCSTDDTAEVCRNWLDANRDRFIRVEIVVAEKNKGIPANCNQGLKVSKAEWIKLIAGDDALFPNCIEVNLERVLQNSFIRVLLSNVDIYQNIFDDNHKINSRLNISLNNFFKDTITAQEQYRLLLKGDLITITPTLFINRDTLISVKGFDERFKHIEDYPMWLKLTKSGCKIYYFDSVTVKYRMSDDSICNTQKKYLIKPAFFKNEELRKVYVYPNISFHEYLYKRYYYFCSVLMIFLSRNRPSMLNSIIFTAITFNISKVIRFIKRIFGKERYI